jgi:hypothetical protein
MQTPERFEFAIVVFVEGDINAAEGKLDGGMVQGKFQSSLGVPN